MDSPLRAPLRRESTRLCTGSQNPSLFKVNARIHSFRVPPAYRSAGTAAGPGPFGHIDTISPFGTISPFCHFIIPGFPIGTYRETGFLPAGLLEPAVQAMFYLRHGLRFVRQFKGEISSSHAPGIYAVKGL